MPNWCHNRAKITAPNEDAACRLFSAFMRGETCDEFLPVAINDPSWYAKRCQLWGVKWDIGAISEVYAEGSILGTQVELNFDSAWSPPTAFYEHLEAIGYKVDAVHYEPNMMFGGWFSDAGVRKVTLDVPSLEDIHPRLREAFGDDEFRWIFDFDDEEVG